MKAINILVASMAIVFSTAAMNEVSAQNSGRQTSKTVKEQRQTTTVHNNEKQTTTAHHNNKHTHTTPQAHHNEKTGKATHAPHPNYGRAHHTSIHNAHIHNHQHYIPSTPVTHVVHHNQPTHLVVEHHNPVRVIHHVYDGYVPQVGHIVDILPAGYVCMNVNGVTLYYALGYTFRPIIIDGMIRYLVE